MWEHWDSVNENGEFWHTKMNSFNHYTYGAVCDWLFGDAAGIKIADDGAGYKKITLTPIPDARLGRLSYSIDTREGRISSSWRYTDERTVRYEFDLPSGTVAEMTLAGGTSAILCGGSYVFTERY